MSYSFRDFAAAPTAAEHFRSYFCALRSAWRRSMRPAWCFVAFGATLLAVLCALTDFKVPSWLTVIEAIACIAAILGGAVFFERDSRHRMALACEAMALFVSTIMVAMLLESIIASATFPLEDSALAAADRWLGIDWVATAYWFRDHPALTTALCYAYMSIGSQGVAIIPALAYADPERLRRIMAASTVVLAITLIVFLFAPALGPYTYFRLPTSDFPNVVVAPWLGAELIENLRAGAHEFHLVGVVTFPSYHAVIAVLFVYGWFGVPFLRWLFVPLNLAMLVSTVPIGSHYVIDVIVGAALAIGFYWLADRYFRATDQHPPLPFRTEAQEYQRIKDWLGRVLGRNGPKKREAIPSAENA